MCSPTVLVVESETDAARATMLFPQCDVAVLPAGARYFTAAFADQLRPYERILIGLDNDEAGEAGALKIAEAVPQALRFTPPAPAKDWCEVLEPPTLPVLRPGVNAVGGIKLTSVATLLREGVPAPEILVEDLMYAEGVHLISGHPDCGKTTLALAIAIWVMASRHVLWLDFESGLRQTVRRLDAMEVEPDLAEERFHYAGWPPEPEAHFSAVAALWPGALIVIDSMSKALSQAGLDENSNTEVTTWTTKIVRACKDNGLPVAIIDHIAKSGGESDYSRGAGAKLADVDVHWRVIKEVDFDRSQQGRIKIVRKKDREAYMPAEQAWTVGDGEGRLVLEPTELSDVGSEMSTRVRAFLASQAGTSFTKTDVVTAVTGKTVAIRAALEALAADPAEHVHLVSRRYVYDPSLTAEQVPI